MAPEQRSRQPELRHRAAAAAGASIVSVLLVNPLDVVKVADLGPSNLGSAERCANSAPFRPASATGVLRDIVRKEGVTALWRGADTAVLAAIPMVGVYMPLYDSLLERSAPMLGAYAPAIAGSAARTAAVLLVGPLELVRTRQQGGAAGARTAWGALRDTLRETTAAAAAGAAAAPSGTGRALGGGGGGGSLVAALRTLPRLWTGVGATLARDVPFSALYWAMLEPIRGGLMARWGYQHPGSPSHRPSASPQQQELQAAQAQADTSTAPPGRAVLAANLIAGSAAGALAAVVTTPFDVVKTRLQVGDVSARASTLSVVRQVLEVEGPPGLFRGWGPRAARTAPACAVVVASYEVLKLLL
ncbi:hypothetical protein GPECTOR_50g569 [Gonium pectorale]|uniref:Uncharacterized protein n=1 Tax=Gonium pectorale TaxID=33097 RepID=A0A150G7D4_GONPE|nr:hypothetical protein GPECTOR_50g569 [Gonium pectorale]|eukprot:KXZ45776.1 hypothetical protein GPECTOR_50g569 [Gonium pectorale]